MKMCLRQTLRLGLNNYGSKLRVVEHIWIECHKTKVKTNYFPVVLLSQSQPAIKLKPKETTDYFQHLIIRKLYRISYINFYRGQIHFFDFVSHCKSTQGTPAKIAIVFRLLSCISSQGWEGERSLLHCPPFHSLTLPSYICHWEHLQQKLQFFEASIILHLTSWDNLLNSN